MSFSDDLVILARGGTADLTAHVESKLEGKFGLEINYAKMCVVDGICWDTRSGMIGTARDAGTAHSRMFRR